MKILKFESITIFFYFSSFQFHSYISSVSSFLFQNLIWKAVGRPVFEKYHKNIELKYRANRNAWTVIDHEKTGEKTILIAYVDAECPEHIKGMA